MKKNFFYALLIMCVAACANWTDEASFGTVSLTVNGSLNSLSARTILPDEPLFSTYRLSFTPKDDQSAKPDEIVQSEEGVVKNIYLAPGDWEIDVYARISVDNGSEREIAQGNSGVITVLAGRDVTAEVTLTSIKGGKGTFTWSIAVSPAVGADSYSITLTEINNTDGEEPLREEAIGGGIDGGLITGEREVDAADYWMEFSIRLADSGESKLLDSGIVHVLSGLTSRFERSVSESEFPLTITLSGTAGAELFMSGLPTISDVKEVWAYSNADEPVGVSSVGNNGQWSMTLLETPEPQDLHFTILTVIGEDEFEVDTETVLSAGNSDVSEISLNGSLSIIVLSGNINPLGVSSHINWEISAYTDPEQRTKTTLVKKPSKTDYSGDWSMMIPSFADATDVYFTIKDPSGAYERVDIKKTLVHDENLSSISITGYFIPPKQVWISGTLPGMDNWAVSAELKQNGNKFAYTYTHKDFAINSYAVKFLAYFNGAVSEPNWTEAGETVVKYDYDHVVEISGEPPEYLDYRDGTGREIVWLNQNSRFAIKTVKFLLDFSGDAYFQTGKPSLIIERRAEVLVPSGTFTMGSPATEEGRNGPSGLSSEVQHTVTISKPLWFMEAEVTQRLYKEVIPDYENSGGADFIGDDYPVVNVSWFDAVKFANELSERDGFKSVYTINGAEVTVDWNAAGWRLPTEAEWEYAARGRGSPTTPFGIGERTKLTTDIANYDGTKSHLYNDVSGAPGVNRGRIIGVHSFAPNNWGEDGGRGVYGLFNMHGNVWEFCWDWYADYVVSGVQTDPKGYNTPSGGWENGRGNGNDGKASAADSMGKRIIRGGSYFCSTRYLRSAHRGVLSPNETSIDIGFRLVRLAE